MAGVRTQFPQEVLKSGPGQGLGKARPPASVPQTGKGIRSRTFLKYHTSLLIFSVPPVCASLRFS